MSFDTDPFTADLLRIVQSPALAVSFLRRWEGTFIPSVKPLDTADRVVAASEMLREGMPRSEIRDALMARFGESRATAYRDISAALNRRPA